MNKIKVFLSSTQRDDDTLLEREALSVLFEKEPLCSLFKLWRIEDSGSSLPVDIYFKGEVAKSQALLVIINQVGSEHVEEEIKEARENYLPIFMFINQNAEPDAPAKEIIKEQQSYSKTVNYSDIKDLCSKVEDALLGMVEISYALERERQKRKEKETAMPEKLQGPDSWIIETRYYPFLTNAMFLGAWDENNQNDRAVIEGLSGKPYTEWQAVLAEVRMLNQDMLSVKNGRWKVNGRKKLFKYFSQYILDQNLKSFEKLAKKVLVEIDPQFDLEEKDRFMAAILNKKPKYSPQLRNGIAEILPILSLNRGLLSACSTNLVDNIISIVVQTVLSTNNWKAWASAGSIMPLLAEAAPDTFMLCVEDALRADPCPFDELFRQENGGVLAVNYMTGLYWALEDLAWNEEYLSWVVNVLAGLANRDPGGNWANRPGNSIVHIVLPWHPQTRASFKSQLSSIKNIYNYFPKVAWKVLVSLLRNVTLTTSGTYRPEYRNPLEKDWKQNISTSEYAKHLEAYQEIILEMIQENSAYIAELAEYFGNLEPATLEKLLGILSSDKIKALPDTEKQPIRDALMVFVARNRSMPDAKWALSSTLVDKIDAVAQLLTPSSPLYSHKILFGKNEYIILGTKNKDDWKKRAEDLRGKQIAALNEIISYGGIKSLFDFIASLDDVSYISPALPYLENVELENKILPAYLVSDKKEEKLLAGGYARSKFYKEGDNWISTGNLADWTQEEKCELLLSLAFDEKVRGKAPVLLANDEGKFWSKLDIYPGSIAGDLETVIDKCLEYGHPLYAIGLINAYYEQKKVLLADKAVKAFKAGIGSHESNESVSVYDLQSVMLLLQKEQGVNKDDMSEIEWAYFGLFDTLEGEHALFLEQRLAADPDFFMELISMLYKSTDEKIQGAKKKYSGAIVDNGFKLFEAWKIVPGTQEDGIFSEADFSAWLRRVKDSAKAQGYEYVSMLHIGQVLYYSPQDKSGLWINKTIAKTLDAQDADDMRRGYVEQVYNARGVHIVDESGQAEMKIAQSWAEKAEAAESAGYVHFAASLKTIVKQYEKEAERIKSQAIK